MSPMTNSLEAAALGKLESIQTAVATLGPNLLADDGIQYFVPELLSSAGVLRLNMGDSGIMVAAAYGHCEIVRYLVDLKSSVNMQSSIGSTALMYAAGVSLDITRS